MNSITSHHGPQLIYVYLYCIYKIKLNGLIICDFIYFLLEFEVISISIGDSKIGYKLCSNLDVYLPIEA